MRFLSYDAPADRHALEVLRKRGRRLRELQLVRQTRRGNELRGVNKCAHTRQHVCG